MAARHSDKEPSSPDRPLVPMSIATQSPTAADDNDHEPTGNGSGVDVGVGVASPSSSQGDKTELQQQQKQSSDANGDEDEKFEFLTDMDLVRSRLQLIEPFKPNYKRLDYATANLTKTRGALLQIRFEDDAVHSEWIRWMYRDFSTIICAFFFAGSFLYPPTHVFAYKGETSWMAIVAYVTGAFNGVMVAVDQNLHMHFLNTLTQAQVRRVVAVLVVFVACLSNSFTMYAVVTGCDSSIMQITAQIDPGFVPAAISNERRIKYCVDSINKLPVMYQTMCLAMARVPLQFAVPISFLHIVLTEAGRKLGDAPGQLATETEGQMAVKIFVLIAVAVFAACLMYAREQLFARQFVSMATLEKEKRRLRYLKEQHAREQSELRRLGTPPQRDGDDAAPAAAAAAAAASLPDDDNDDAAHKTLQDKLAQRKHNWFILDFADDALEDEFGAFASEQTENLRLISACSLVGIAAILSICIVIESAELSMASTVLCGIKNVAGVAFLVATVRHRILDGFVQLAAIVLISVLTLFEAGLLPNAVVGNDVTYLQPFFTMVLSFGVWRETGALKKILVNLVCFVGPVLYLASKSVLISGDIVFQLFAILLISWQVVVTEKYLRQQFAEAKLMEVHRRRQEQVALMVADDRPQT